MSLKALTEYPDWVSRSSAYLIEIGVDAVVADRAKSGNTKFTNEELNDTVDKVVRSVYNVIDSQVTIEENKRIYNGQDN